MDRRCVPTGAESGQMVSAESRFAKDQLAIILDAITDGITVQDRSGELIYANATAARVLGFPAVEALLTTPVLEILGKFEIYDEAGNPFPPAELPGRLALQGVCAAEAIIRSRPAGTQEDHWAVVRSTPVFDAQGEVRFAINVFRDLTEWKRTEDERTRLLAREQAARAAAEAAQHRLAFLAEASNVLASSLDYETTLHSLTRLAVPTLADWCSVDLLEADGTFRGLGGAHVDPAKERFLHELQRRYPPDPQGHQPGAGVLQTHRSAILPEVSDAYLEATSRDAGHLALRRALGYRSVMIVPLLARDRMVGTIAFVRAEAGRPYGPEDLALAEDLARRAAQAVDNARLYREAQEAVRARNELFSLVSHDLKNPLAVIKSQAQLMKRRASRAGLSESDHLLEGLASIDARVNKMTALIDELLDMARLQIGQPLELDRRPTDLVALAHQVADVYQRATESHRIVIEAAAPELVGHWDADRLERVLGNLLANAIKYTPDGGQITLSVTWEEAADGDWAVLTVQDQGVGIPSGDLPRIFERFFRAGNVAGQIQGAGLGLASARQVVEQHGGTITVDSQEGVGSTFSVRLPL